MSFICIHQTVLVFQKPTASTSLVDGIGGSGGLLFDVTLVHLKFLCF